MKHLSTILTAFAWIVSLPLHAAPTKPNIVLIFIDDM